MRVRVDGGTTTTPNDGAVSIRDRLHWAFGRYATEIRLVRVNVRVTAEGVECVVRVLLPDHRLEFSETAETEDEAVRVSVSRAGAAVARWSDLKRLLGN